MREEAEEVSTGELAGWLGSGFAGLASLYIYIEVLRSDQIRLTLAVVGERYGWVGGLRGRAYHSICFCERGMGRLDWRCRFIHFCSLTSK